MTTPAGRQFLDVKGLAELLGLPVKWVYTAVEGGLIPHSRFGKHIRFSPKDVDDIEQRHHRKAAAT